MMSTNNFLKIYYDGKIKKCDLPKDFSMLKEFIKMSFSSSNLPKIFHMYYMDNEKDMILIENQFDFENALLYMKQHHLITLQMAIRTPNDKFDYSNAVQCLDSSSIDSINMMHISDDAKDLKMDLKYLCNKCGRHFACQDSQMKHSNNCIKVFGTKRLPFDSKIQRRRFSELSLDDNHDDMKEKLSLSPQKLRKAMKKWIKCCNKKVQLSKRTFRDLYVDVDSIQCNTCNRKFNHASYKKHAKNCIKIMMKRNPFDSRRQRCVSMEQANLIAKNEMMMLDNHENLSKEKCEPSWKRLSNKFKEIVRASKKWFKNSKN